MDEDLIHELVEKAKEGELIDLGEYQARKDYPGFATTYPKTAAEYNSIDDDSEFSMFLEKESRALIVMPKDGE